MLDPALYPITRGPEPLDKDPAERLLRELHSLGMQEARSRGYGDAVETKAEYDGLKSGLGELNMEWNERMRYAYGVNGQTGAQAQIDATISRTSAGYAAKRMRDDPGSFGRIEGGVRHSLSSVQPALILGAVLCIAVIYFFLNWRSAIITGLALLISAYFAIIWNRPARAYALECTARLAELLEERAKIERRMESMQRMYDSAERLLAFALTPERRQERMLQIGAMMRGLTSDQRGVVQHRIQVQEWVVVTRAWVMAEEKAMERGSTRGGADEGKPGVSGWGAAMNANRQAEHALQELAAQQGEQVAAD